MNDVPEFAGSVQAIRTDVLVEKAAEDLYPGWEKNQEQWKLGSMNDNITSRRLHPNFAIPDADNLRSLKRHER